MRVASMPSIGGTFEVEPTATTTCARRQLVDRPVVAVTSTRPRPVIRAAAAKTTAPAASRARTCAVSSGSAASGARLTM